MSRNGAAPFDTAELYRRVGWSGTLALPTRKKAAPPDGFTGHDGRWPTDDDLSEWRREGSRTNIAIRMPPFVLGIDFDCYAPKRGAATRAELVAQYGELPPTWRSTSRGPNDPSYIAWFRIPHDIDNWPSTAGPDVELIRHAHRYAVVWPSVHPEGRIYQWVRPDGTVADPGEIPPPSELAALPASWVEGLTGVNPRNGKRDANHVRPGSRAERRAAEAEAREWINALPKGEPCAYVGRLAADVMAAARRESGNAYDHTRDAVFALLRAGETGHHGVRRVLLQARAEYVATVADTRGGESVALGEFERFTLDGAAKIRANPGTRAGRGCDCPSTNGAGSKDAETADPEAGVATADFYAYMPMHSYIFAPSGEMWPGSSVNARISPIPTGRVKDNGKEEFETASAWLDRNQPVEQMTWVPGEPMLISDRLISHGGWIDRPGCTCFNLYKPPTIRHGDAGHAYEWIEHVYTIYPNEAEHIIAWLAHRVQHPAVKVNHALLLGGTQGIGKDTILEPVKHAVGPWNFTDVSPGHLLGRFNGFVKSVILRVSEARDLGDVDRYGFYEHMKAYTAAPPDVLRVDEKNIREYAVPNVCGVIVTTNHKTDGIYLPADDRRHFVAWSDLTKDDFTADYWDQLYAWYARGGYGHVAAYLAGLDLSAFNPKAPPPKTDAFWDIVDANRAPEDAELADALEALGNPDATTLSEIAEKAEETRSQDFAEWLRDRRNSRKIPHRLEAEGYVAVRCDSTKDGRWKVNGKNQVVYARRELSVRDRIVAARKLSEGAR